QLGRHARFDQACRFDVLDIVRDVPVFVVRLGGTLGEHRAKFARDLDCVARPLRVDPGGWGCVHGDHPGGSCWTWCNIAPPAISLQSRNCTAPRMMVPAPRNILFQPPFLPIWMTAAQPGATVSVLPIPWRARPLLLLGEDPSLQQKYTQGSYGQFCPVAMAAEIVCSRWTALVLRELLCGTTRFNDLRRGVPRMSPTLLSKRLKELEQAGVITVKKKREAGVAEYKLTDAGEDLRNVVL